MAARHVNVVNVGHANTYLWSLRSDIHGTYICHDEMCNLPIIEGGWRLSLLEAGQPLP